MKQGLNTINTFIVNSQAGETVSLIATSVSTSVSFTLPQSAKNYDIIIQNLGTQVAFCAFGLASAGTVTAATPAAGKTNTFPCAPGAIYTMQKQSDAQMADTCAAICNSGQSTTLYFTSVQGS